MLRRLRATRTLNYDSSRLWRPRKPGTATRIFSTLQHAGINLLGVSVFPHGARRSQVDFIPEDSATFTKAAKSMGLI